MHYQSITDLRWSGPNSNILVKDAETNRKKRLLDPEGNLIREYKRERRIVV